MDREPLEWWLDWSAGLIELTDDAYLQGAVELDYSEASLRALEAVVRDRYNSSVQVLGDDPFAAGVVAYLGETLMRLAGGAWGWTAEALPDTELIDPSLQSVPTHRWHISGGDEPDVVGQPIVQPDPALGLAALAPISLLLGTIDRPEPGLWTATYGQLRQAVDDYAASNPGWAPVKEHTLADGPATPPTSSVLDEWLARRHAGFPDWTARYGNDWDFSVESLDRLAGLAVQITPDVADFDPAKNEFVDGAIYYLGEVFRRAVPATWVYREFRDEEDPEIADFQIQGPGDFTSPYYLLRRMIRLGNSEHLAEMYQHWVSQ